MMGMGNVFSVAGATLIVLVTALLRVATKKSGKGQPNSDVPQEPSTIARSLAAALPGRVLLPGDATFLEAAQRHWAQQASQVIPGCVVRPHNASEVGIAIKLLSAEGAAFAVRSGGHSWVTGASSIRGETLIDLSLMCDVTLSEDKSSVVIGSGARWGAVSRVLDSQGVAVVGGRNSDVGVGGFLLGGGISFLSPRYGLACSNIISYEVVLGSGEVATASASSRPDLWQALKGGANNFGIVTRFTARCFPQGSVWGGYLHLPAFQSAEVLAAFRESLQSADEDVAGPMACFSYIHGLRAEIISVGLMCTKAPARGWPAHWKTSRLASLWRYWSTCKTRTLSDATDELEGLNPSGKRQQQTTATVRNDAATLAAAHAIYKDAAAALRRAGVKGLVWTLVVQPLAPAWLRKGDPNPMGLDGHGSEPLVLVLYLAVWEDAKDDAVARAQVHQSTERLEEVAAANGTLCPYKYLNYCGDGQEPLRGYGEAGLHYLREASRKYDPNGMFQRQCVGGFKLGMEEPESGLEE
ncbi:FAD-binding domain-containing protein [Thozetella sp. PMI_491]|nr:FAD-binding domain-containing protein [Thozetella sp. PMI_491]